MPISVAATRLANDEGGTATGQTALANTTWLSLFEEAQMASSARQKRKVGRVMHEYKHGQLKTRGRRRVKSRRQAVAIAMSESGQSRRRKSSRSRSRSRGKSRSRR
jgi:hypothetical protein